MNKYFGKYEKNVRKSMLQAYFISLVALMLCVTMFLGTSFAWFTSNVENSENVLQIGTLDVDLLLGEGGDKWTSLKNTSTNKLFDANEVWEPGHLMVKDLMVKNKGNLDFDYQLNFAGNLYYMEGGKQLSLSQAASAFEVWVFDHQKDTVYTAPANFDAITASNSGWEKVGTLAQVLTGTAVFSGSMSAADTQVKYTIAVHMNRNAPSELMGQKLTLDVKLTAHQKLTNVWTTVTTGEDLKSALEAGGYVKLGADIALDNAQIQIPAGVHVTLDLNGKKLTGDYTGTDHYAMFTIPHDASMTVNDSGSAGGIKATTKSETDNRSLAIFLNHGKLTINGGDYEVNDASENKTWIIATIVDNRTNKVDCNTVLTINGGEFWVKGKAKNLFRNYPQQGGTVTLIINDGVFHDKSSENLGSGNENAYIWNQEASTHIGELFFCGGQYDTNVVYEDYNGQKDIFILGTAPEAYSGNN